MCVLFATEQNPGNVRRMFNILRDLVPNADPDIILLDFELAARNAFTLKLRKLSECVSSRYFAMQQNRSGKKVYVNMRYSKMV